MTNIYTVAAIRQLEILVYQKLDLSPYELMQKAGTAAFKLIQQKWQQVKQVAIFCGGGNNGGDGYIIASLVKAAGMQVKVYQLGSVEQLPGPAKQAYLHCLALEVDIQPFNAQSELEAEIIVDALLGIGIKGSVRPDYSKAIQLINKANKPVLAIDVPSGVNANTGAVSGQAVRADITITFIGLKQGLMTGPATDYCGQVLIDTLNLPINLYDNVTAAGKVLDLPAMKALLPKRKRNTHKGNYGHVLVVGGNYGMAGAVRLAGEAAARTGAGLVTIATRPEHIVAITSARPEMLCYGITQSQQLEPLLAKAAVIAVGPGLGQDQWAQAMWQLALASNKPMVVDADALNLLANKPMHNNNWILTPHPGEAARLLGKNSQEIQMDRYAAATLLQQQYRGVTVLKGAGSIIHDAANMYLCSAGNPGMASAGMGDILTGIIAGLLAQGLSLQEAACAGVMFHAQAGDQIAAKRGERGILALELLAELPCLINA